jgi:hypothetical protein
MAVNTPSASKGIVIKPWVYFIPAVICGIAWLLGTAVQVQTSEQWMMQSSVSTVPTLSTFVQVWIALHGQLPQDMVVPFMFGWGVQVALIVASFGAELPRDPEWRFKLCWGIIILLVIVNSCGDWNYSSPYGVWGQSGFSLVILFLTFGCGFLCIACAMHGIKKMRGA